MHLYHMSNSSSMYCSTNPRTSSSCSSCLSYGANAGCGWCLATNTCQTKTGCGTDWLRPGQICLHDAFYTCIVLIIILVIILIIILLLFFIFYIMDYFFWDLNKRKLKRLKASSSVLSVAPKEKENKVDNHCWCSDDSYIYGKNLSIGMGFIYCTF